MDLPDSLKRSGAQRLADRERALLDNFETVRCVEAGVPPDLKDDLISWLGSCLGMGLETREEVADEHRSVYVVKLDGVTIAHLWMVEDDEGRHVKLYPTDNARRRRR